MEQERQSDPDYYRALADLAVLELGRARRSSLRVPLPDASDRRLLALCQAVMANPSLDIGLERLAEDARASVRTLSRLFQRSLGMGFADWRRQVQLATAAAALIDGRPVAGIAHALDIRRAPSATCSAASWASLPPSTGPSITSRSSLDRHSIVIGR